MTPEERKALKLTARAVRRLVEVIDKTRRGIPHNIAPGSISAARGDAHGALKALGLDGDLREPGEPIDGPPGPSGPIGHNPVG